MTSLSCVDTGQSSKLSIELWSRADTLPSNMPLRRRTFLRQLGLGAAALNLASTFPLSVEAASLKTSAPEAQGVSSAGILAFLQAVADSKHEFHSFMMVRHGAIIAEGWWRPYRPNARHMLYSLSKSFTSTSVGFAVTEGLLKIDAPVTSFSQTISHPLSATNWPRCASRTY